jgi:hypothetical protein
MASTPTFDPNPYANFDPSQWANPYSQFYGQALPWPSSYVGTPNNALGQPIAAPQGMTLNSTPAQPQAPAQAQSPASALQAMMSSPSAMNPSGNAAVGMANWGGFLPPGTYAGGLPSPQGPPQQQAAPQAAAPAAPNNWQQTLSMLANPGHVTTPGATVPQAQSSTALNPGVLQSFLSNWKPAQSGPGSGFQQNFNTILRGLQAPTTKGS